MEKVCPACNKLSIKTAECKNCSNIMTDYGRAQEIYQDDYTANMPINDNTDYCIHVFKCESCGSVQSAKVYKINI